jgi:hypothetical protein
MFVHVDLCVSNFMEQLCESNLVGKLCESNLVEGLCEESGGCIGRRREGRPGLQG